MLARCGPSGYHFNNKRGGFARRDHICSPCVKHSTSRSSPPPPLTVGQDPCWRRLCVAWERPACSTRARPTRRPQSVCLTVELALADKYVWIHPTLHTIPASQASCFGTTFSATATRSLGATSSVGRTACSRPRSPPRRWSTRTGLMGSGWHLANHGSPQPLCRC